MQRLVWKEFNSMKSNLKNILKSNSSKLSFTVDSWTGKNSKSYYAVTLHFIDSNWEL